MHKHEYAEICKKKYAEICKKYANICMCPMSLPQLHIYAKICKKYAKYASMKFICIICTPHFADGTVHTKQAKSQARKGARGNKGSCKPTVTGGLGQQGLEIIAAASQARTPNRAKRGASVGTGSRRARMSHTMTSPGRGGRTYWRLGGFSLVDPSRGEASR